VPVEQNMAWALSRVLAGAAFMATAILSVSLAGAADDWKTCAEAPDDVAIAACTRAIDSGTYEGRDLSRLHNSRGIAWHDKGDLDRAIADYSEAIRLNPKYTIAYRNRGLANLYAGTPPKALADLAQAHGLDPKNAYTALWLDIAGNRSNLASRLHPDGGNLADVHAAALGTDAVLKNPTA